MGEASVLFELLRRAGLRIRLQRAANGACAIAVPALVGLAAAMPAIQLGLLARSGFPLLLGAAAGLVLLGWLGGLLWKVRLLEVAYRLDRANANADRLGSALEFLRLGAGRTPLMGAEIRDAAQSVARIEISRAFPWRLPRAARGVLLACLLLAAASFHEAPPAARPAPPPPPPTPGERLLAGADLAAQREVVAEMKADAARLQEEQLAGNAERLEQLLDQLEHGRVGREEALEELLQIQAAVLQTPPAQPSPEALTRQLAKAAEELKKDKETRALGEALERKELERARSELQRLARLLAEEKVSPGLLERLAKVFGEMAKKLAEKLGSKEIEELSREIARLRQELGQRGLSSSEDERLRALEEKLRQAMRKQGAEPGEQPERATEEGLRSLNQLRRRMDEAVQQLTEAARQKKEGGRQQDRQGKGRQGQQGQQQGQGQQGQQQGQGQPGQEQQEEAGRQLEQGASALDRLQRAREQAQARKQAEQRVGQMREVMKRSGGGGEQTGQRARQLDEFDRRAGREGGQASSEGSSGQADGTRGGTQPAGAQPPPEPAGDRQQGRQPNQLSRSGEAGKGPPGTSVDPRGLGRPTAPGERAGAEAKLERLTGKRVQGGESRTEVVEGAAEKGFARVGYRQVFTEFASVAEEELDRVQVPAGYRYYVRRYFELIRPRE